MVDLQTTAKRELPYAAKGQLRSLAPKPSDCLSLLPTTYVSPSESCFSNTTSLRPLTLPRYSAPLCSPSVPNSSAPAPLPPSFTSNPT